MLTCIYLVKILILFVLVDITHPRCRSFARKFDLCALARRRNLSVSEPPPPSSRPPLPPPSLSFLSLFLSGTWVLCHLLIPLYY